MPPDTPWTQPLTLDKIHNYLESPVFPWNVLFEGLPEPCLEHWARFVPDFHWLHRADEASIAREVRATCRDYLVNPHSEHAQRLHRGYVHEYPFAYPQVRVFGSLQREGRNIFEVTDVPGAARLLGIYPDDIRELEARAARLAAEAAARPRCSDTDLRGRTLVDTQGNPLGEVEDLLHEGENLVELRVRPLREIRHPGLRRIGDSLAISLETVTLWSPFHDNLVLHQTV